MPIYEVYLNDGIQVVLRADHVRVDVDREKYQFRGAKTGVEGSDEPVVAEFSTLHCCYAVRAEDSWSPGSIR